MTRLLSSLAAAVCWLGLLLPTAAGLLPSAHAVTRMPQPAHARAGPLPVVMGRKGRPKMPAGMVRALIGIRNPCPLCVEYAPSLSPELSEGACVSDSLHPRSKAARSRRWAPTRRRLRTAHR